MICFWIQKRSPNGPIMRKLRGVRTTPAKACSSTGPMEFTMHEVIVPNLEGFPRKKTLRLFTLFDDNFAPPKLVREDYSIEDLRELGAPLPAIYVNTEGSIVNLDGEVIMKGPDGELDKGFATRKK